MQRKQVAFLLVFVMVLAAGSARSQGASATPGVDARQERQQHRIDQGVASGALTPREQARLQAQQASIARAEARAKSDGKVTAAERARLHQRQDHASRQIRRQKHDGQRR